MSSQEERFGLTRDRGEGARGAKLQGSRDADASSCS
jgi:hypothetical protein